MFRAMRSKDQVRRAVWRAMDREGVSRFPGAEGRIPNFAGAKLEANYPFSVITDGMGLNITVMSYMGHMDFGIVADRDQMPDVWCLMDWLREELAALKPRPKRRRKTSAA